MILYTPMQLELVFEGLENMQAPKTKLVNIGGTQVLVEETNPGEGKVNRVLSTDPSVYLKQEMSPGSVVRYSS